MLRAEVNRISSLHGGANVPDSGALVELWGIYDASRQAARPCHVIYLEEEKKKKLLLVPKRENDTRYMNICDEHTIIKGESCPGEAL